MNHKSGPVKRRRWTLIRSVLREEDRREQGPHNRRKHRDMHAVRAAALARRRRRAGTRGTRARCRRAGTRAAALACRRRERTGVGARSRTRSGARRGRGDSGQRGEEIRRLERDTVGRRRDRGCVRQRADGHGVWRLGVRQRLPIGRVDADEALVVGVAHLEHVVLCRVRADVVNTDTIETVVAVAVRVGVHGIAGLEAGDVVADEAGG